MDSDELNSEMIKMTYIVPEEYKNMRNIIGKEFWNANQGREVGVPGCVLHHRKVELLRWVLHHEEYSYSVR